MNANTSLIFTDFVDAAEGDEPIDLLLKELIPLQLSDLDLPLRPALAPLMSPKDL